MAQPYTGFFYAENAATAAPSARVVTPLLLELVRPRSVVDVGCSTGAWLAAFRELGVEDVLGIDGPQVPAQKLAIPADRFRAHDLTQPLRVERTFDLVLSMEVAEHLPERCAGRFVEALTGLGPVVAFSAAVPGQSGQRHVNEQWPEYWVERFARRGYAAIDCLRPRLWNRPEVAWWYAQNLLLFADEQRLAAWPALAAERRYDRPGGPWARVHPRAWERACDPREADARFALRALPCALRAAARRRLAALGAALGLRRR